MAIRPEALPTDAAALTEMVRALDAENEKLRMAMQTLKEMIFGKRSERLVAIVAEQLALELERSRDRRHTASVSQRRSTCNETGWEAAQEGEGQHRCVAQAFAALRAGARAGHDSVPVLSGHSAQDRRGCERGAGRDPGDPAGTTHGSSQIRLPRLHRRRGPGEGAAAFG
ncbi:hypothetical protein [Bradyrhizobium neotropicale]|uniref:hypothetical protein n=1 Tax=Bradyrhizobium neotropicale TaxID=1497615 RepID=UPI00289F474B|nr:hypothetical protein [Bradyrhizobium neotropicale]